MILNPDLWMVVGKFAHNQNSVCVAGRRNAATLVCVFSDLRLLGGNLARLCNLLGPRVLQSAGGSDTLVTGGTFRTDRLCSCVSHCSLCVTSQIKNSIMDGWMDEWINGWMNKRSRMTKQSHCPVLFKHTPKISGHMPGAARRAANQLRTSQKKFPLGVQSEFLLSLHLFLWFAFMKYFLCDLIAATLSPFLQIRAAFPNLF